jgi:hypothetical protein
MYLLGTIVLIVWGMYVYPGNISNIPFAQLTLNKVFDAVLSGTMFFGAIYLGFESLIKDRIWPWRWTWLYLASIVLRALVCGLLVGAFYYVAMVRFKLDGWLLLVALAVLAILMLSTMFNPDFDLERKSAPVAEAEKT